MCPCVAKTGLFGYCTISKSIHEGIDEGSGCDVGCWPQLILDRTSGAAQVEQRDTPWEAFLEQSGVRGYFSRCLGKYHCVENREPADVLVYALSTAEATLMALPLLDSSS